MSRALLAGVVMGVAALFAFMTLTEWWSIIVVQDPAHLASYHFGSAPAVGQGGWRYASRAVYAWTSFSEALAAMATLPMLWFTIVRRSRKAAIALVILCAAYVVVSLILAKINWPTTPAFG